MKYHKIMNVDLTVCTAEQKIAYNLAFQWYDIISKEYNRLPMQFQKSSFISEAIKRMMENYKKGYNYNSKYDEDAIFSALNSGLEKYLNLGYHILQTYEDIGKIFPANYL